MTPAGTSNELDVQNEWEEKHTHREIIIWPISVPNNVPTKILIISVEFFTGNSLSTELGISRGSGNFGEYVPDLQNAGKNPPTVPQAFNSVLQALHGVSGKFLRNFCKKLFSRL